MARGKCFCATIISGDFCVFNELIVQSGSELNLPILDLCSVSLSAGCGFYDDAIHFDRSMQASLNDSIVSRLVFRMIRPTECLVLADVSIAKIIYILSLM